MAIVAGGIFLGGVSAIAAYLALERYIKERRQRMALDPSYRQNISHVTIDDMSDWAEYNASMWQQVSPYEKIQRARIKLRMDIESTVHVAVCGNSGTGKSTFINCVRGLPDVEARDNFVHKEDGSAPVGIMETTRQIMSYRWPDNQMPHLVLWDLPAAGTTSRSNATYFEKLELYAFDCILLLRAGRFTQFDVVICQQALQYKIPIVLVVNKADQDVSSYKKIKTRKLGRKLMEVEYQELVSQTTLTLKTNALAELTAIPAGKNSNLTNIPMFVIAAQSYRDQLNHALDPEDCPPLETQDLLEHCLTAATDRLKKITDEYHETNIP